MAEGTPKPSGKRAPGDSHGSAPGQLALWQPGTLDEVLGVIEKGTGVYTADRFKLRDPERFELCCVLLASGSGLLWIADKLGLSHHTVAAVRDRHTESVEREKVEISKTLRRFAGIAAERILDEVHLMDRDKLPVNLAVAIDKIQILDGQPSQIIETRDGESAARDRERWEAWAASLPSAEAVEPDQADQANQAAPAVELKSGDSDQDQASRKDQADQAQRNPDQAEPVAIDKKEPGGQAEPVQPVSPVEESNKADQADQDQADQDQADADQADPDQADATQVDPESTALPGAEPDRYQTDTKPGPPSPASRPIKEGAGGVARAEPGDETPHSSSLT